MILHGNQRGGAKDLALHLLKKENEHVEVHEIRGFASDDLVCALNEAHAVSRGTRAKQYLFSVSFNPPPEEKVATAHFEQAIDRVEGHFGLSGQPRVIVFHTKNGRRHAHAVWSRIDPEKMKAIPLPFTKRDLTAISRELYIEHGWRMPQGFVQSERRNPLNFTMAQWQQARRVGKDAREIKAAIQDCWAISNNQSAFRQALKERGFYLARGDRRGFVVLDHRLEVYSVSKWVGVKTKDVRKKLGEPDALKSVEQTKTLIAGQLANHLEFLKTEQQEKLQARASAIAQQKQILALRHQEERQALAERQADHAAREIKERQARFRTGLMGIWDRVTGRHRKIQQENEEQTRISQLRDRQEKDALAFRQLEQSRSLNARENRLQAFKDSRQTELERDIRQYREIKAGERDAFDTAGQEKQASIKLER